MATLYIVTHGDKEGGKDPKLTPTGLRQVRDLRLRLPNPVPFVMAGTGRRHRDTAVALGLSVHITDPILGGPESLDTDGRIVLACGERIEREDYTKFGHYKVALEALFSTLPGGTVIAAGRPLMLMLGMSDKEAKSASLYKVSMCDGKVAGIEEVIATGVTETGAV